VATLVVGTAAIATCDSDPGGGITPFPSDGVAGFGEAAPVDVCIGTARVVPGAAASVCLPAGRALAGCLSDDQCAAPEKCQCGRCVVEACDAATVCPSGEACRGGRCTTACTRDQDCASGEKCSGGGCTRACSGDAECHGGEVCDFLGTCSVKACSDVSPCGGGYTCETVALDADVREPTVATVAGGDVVFFELRTPDGSAVYRARIDGPLHLTADPATPVLSAPAGEKRAGAPSAIAHDSHVDLFVEVGEGKAIGLAKSDDGGRTFAWAEAKLLTPSETWENGAIGSPGAFERGGATYVLYEGGAGAGIGLAKLDGGALARVSAAPVLRPADLEDASFWRSVKAIGTPFALVSGDVVRVYVTGHGIETGNAVSASGVVPAAPNDSIGLFATLDLATFDRYPTGAVFGTIAGLTGSLGEREPAARATASGADLYFVATDASGAASSGLARATTVR
jgi:hypothetical protein